jgi:hypothetical protein
MADEVEYGLSHRGYWAKMMWSPIGGASADNPSDAPLRCRADRRRVDGGG